MGSEPTDRQSEIPELEPSRPYAAPPSAPQQPAARPAPAPAAPTAAATPGTPYFGNTIDLGGDFGLDADEPPLAVAELAVEREPPPSGKTPDTRTVACDPTAVAELAGYGRSSGLLGSVIYAANVMRRRKPIMAKMARAREKLDEAEDARDRELVRFMVQIQPILRKEPRFRPLIAELIRADGTLRESESKLNATRDNAKDELGELQARREQLRSTLAQRGERERQHAAAAGETERARKREEARISRIQIEIRSLKSRASLNPQDPAFSEDSSGIASEIAKLEASAREIQPELSTAREMDAQAQSRLRTAREARVEIQREMARLDEHVEKINEDATAKLDSAQNDVRDVRKKARTAYADVARHLLSDPKPWDTGDIDFSAIRAADKIVLERAQALGMVERALASRDDDVYQQGRNGLLLIAFLMVAVVVTLIVLAVI